MFDEIVRALEDNPYLGAAIVFVLCGIGLPLPEELVLLAAGYLCATFPENISLPVMMAWCAGAILVGDILPFLAGRVFGVRLLRLRWMRLVMTKQRLASFDRWFRRLTLASGLLVLFILALIVLSTVDQGMEALANWKRLSNLMVT